ncbi:hypothetical protein [Pseudomonas sp. C2B4]|uniref:hypothetical protein n=1 Tax=Pseudomonas sp. C2B4 TaxID=2735270 RepID=UPI001586F767|nr:hypothetical protein [Pseudomonas sp. C2B4]NUU37694.1 hypothetical protein [Pseudomonas sp. C2B4]
MNYSAGQSKTGSALDYLTENKLYAYAYEDLARFLVGLETVFQQEFPSSNFHESRPAPAQWLLQIGQTCKNVRTRLSALGVESEDPVYRTLGSIIRHADSIFWNSYRLSEDRIEQAYFDDKVYALLNHLNLRSDGSVRSNGMWDTRCQSEIDEEKKRERNALLDFVRANPAQVVEHVYYWAQNGQGHNCKITWEFEQLVEVFQLLKDPDGSNVPQRLLGP